MNIGSRVFVVEDQKIIHLSQRAFNEFFHRKSAPLPQYAGRTILIAIAICELENRKPKSVIRIDTMRVKVQPDGLIDQDDHLEGLRLAVNRIDMPHPATRRKLTGDTGIVDATSRFNESRWKQRHPALSGPVQKEILTALFGA